MKDDVVEKNNDDPIPRTDSGVFDDAINHVLTVVRKGGHMAQMPCPDRKTHESQPPQPHATIAPKVLVEVPLSPITLTLLHLAPPLVVATTCLNLIDRFELSGVAKTFSYVLTLLATHKSYHYTSGLLYGYKAQEQQPVEKTQPRHVDLGKTHP